VIGRISSSRIRLWHARPGGTRNPRRSVSTAHIAVDADSGPHTVTTTAGSESDVEQIADPLHGKEHGWADSGHRVRKVA